jgi:carbamoyl-phosphate synthase large subunit
MLPIAKNFYNKGFSIYATTGTSKFLRENGINSTTVEKIWKNKNNIINLIQSGKINFVINTPTKGKHPNRDGFKIRRTAIESKIPCFTSLDTANALYKAIKNNKKEQDLDIIDITKI